MNMTEFPDAAICRDPRPTHVMGGFQKSATVYTVAEDGALAPVGKARQCTHEGDAPSVAIAVPPVGRMLIVTVRHGNGSTRWVDLYE